MGRSGRAVRILYVEANEDGTVGGSHQALFDLVTRLSPECFTPVVLFYQDNPFVSRLEEEGVEVHVWEAVREREREVRLSGGRLRKWLDFFLAIWRRRSFLKRHEIDLLHLNNSPWSGNDDWLPACRLAGVPATANAMGGAEEWHPSRIKRYLFRRFDRVFAISEYVAKGMERLGVSRDRIQTIYLGVDRDDFNRRVQRSPEEVRAALGVDSDQLLALMVGNVRHWKGQHVALDALSCLEPERRRQVVLAFAGAPTKGDNYQDRLLETIDECGLDGNVQFLGFRDDVPDLLNASDLAVHASIQPEPFGLVVVEAMAVGTPIAAAASGGPLEILTEDTGFLFDTDHPEELAEVFELALDEPAKLEEVGRRARARVERFSVDQYAREIEAAYTELLHLGTEPSSQPVTSHS